jgi:hypothetical protein
MFNLDALDLPPRIVHETFASDREHWTRLFVIGLQRMLDEKLKRISPEEVADLYQPIKEWAQQILADNCIYPHEVQSILRDQKKGNI